MISAAKFLVETKMVASMNEAKRLIKGGGVKFHNKTVNENTQVSATDDGQFVIHWN